ncbi:hypothetical protein T552_00422 [Pneumocystis carinii B80]|uniref:Uncharacterized protein n=1 Tax=Pneumocystis carinii (strain B80) TaxID=1408658 RepID=A0A0W4ZQR1_PNEC8|nr:hypothetical protein T552_00422 [Pneumocystis carinii B80]KTW30710.1 hypothetical protein T552_00422 [Pneumocystis carinii B80]
MSLNSIKLEEPKNDVSTIEIKKTNSVLDVLPRFDVDMMTAAYMSTMEIINEEEDLLFTEYKELCQELQSWIRSRIVYDHLMTRKRIRLSVDWVIAKEEELEKTRKEIMECMEAVKKALGLLFST